MFDYLTKKLELLADSVFDPLLQWVIGLRWGMRLLLLLAGFGAIALATNWPAFLAYARTGYTASRIMLLSPDKIPIRAEMKERIAATSRRMWVTLKDDFHATERPDVTAWVASQLIVASPQGGVDNPQAMASFIRSMRRSECSCWAETKNDTEHPANPFVSGWILAALSDIDIAATPDEIGFLLGTQAADGWWAVFPVQNSAEYASTYATAWSLFGLHRQLARGLVSKEQEAEVASAVERGAAWLLSHREPNARWKNYPLATAGKISESISGFTLHALNDVMPTLVAEVDREWLQALPSTGDATQDIEMYYVEILSGPGILEKAAAAGQPERYRYRFLKPPEVLQVDHIAQLRLPWMIVATVDAFPHGSVLQRTRALDWLEDTLEQDSVARADLKKENWVRAETLFALKYLLDQT